MAKVFFLDLTKGHKKNFTQLLESLFILSGGINIIKENALCAVKLHVGEQGNVNYVSPRYVKALVDIIKKSGGVPFLTDTTTLYSGRRHRADLHMDLAREHGFDFAPFIVADGLRGDDYVEVQGAKIASLFNRVDTILCISHFKGHLNCGFGGALKNLGMGCASKGGKLQMHSQSKPYIDKDKCIRCLECVDYCLYHAIVEKKDSVEIDEHSCTGCCGCMSICPEKAIRLHWNAASSDLQQGVAKYAAATAKGKKVFYINFLVNISPNCDCFHSNEPMIAPDIGILASFDPVSLDKACYDLIKEPLDQLYPEIDPHVQIFSAEKFKVGESKYEIKSI